MTAITRVTTPLLDRHAGPPSQRVPILRRALLISFALAAIVVGLTGRAAAATRLEQTLANASAEGELIALVNGYRANNGLQPVSSNGALASAAKWMAGDMAAKNYVGHISSDGRSPTQRMSVFGYPATSMYTGEDLGAGYATASAVLAGWQTSAAHNAVLLNPNYNAIGIGLVYNPSSTYTWYWAADFGGPGGPVKAVGPPAQTPVAPPTSSTARDAQPATERVAPAPRSSIAQPPPETVDRETQERAAQTAFIEATARRITNLFVVLHRMGAI